jgi:putative phage-type endonuclease
MIIENSFEQGSDEWHAARKKSIGGTGISKIITSKGDRSKQRSDYLYEKASQILTGKSKPLFKTYEMQWGTDHEPEARDLFSLIKNTTVLECAMIWSDESKTNHVSPDGYFIIDEESGLEIKCPMLKNHVKYLENGKLPTAYILQVQSSLALTGWKSWWFMSYFPDVKPFILKVERDESLIKIIKAEVKIFLRDLNNLIKELKS